MTKLTKKQLQKFWNTLFPLREGQVVILLKDTSFSVRDGNVVKHTRTLKKGAIGRVVHYTEGHPLVQVDFGVPNWSHLLEVRRVRRI